MRQRRAVAPESFTVVDAPWLPVVEDQRGIAADLAPRRTDVYGVIDDIADGLVKLHASPWPSVDRAGRLAFGSPEERESAVFDADALQEAVDRFRSRSQQPGADRPLRLGDVFLIRGYGDVFAPRAPSDWEVISDITRVARDAARVAFYSAIAPTLSDDDQDRGLIGEPNSPPPPPPPPAPRNPAARAQPSV